MRKVLITGGAGFLGTHVCSMYAGMGWEVVAYDNLTKHELARTGYSVKRVRDYVLDLLAGWGVRVTVGDVRNFDHLRRTAEGCDYIVHLAAQPAMTISAEDPTLDFTTNVIGTHNVLRVARKLGVPMVYASTIHVYGNASNAEVREENQRYVSYRAPVGRLDPVAQGSLTPLHASKLAADLYTQAFAHTYNMETAVFRLTGIYGPHQFGGEDHGWVANFAIRAVLGKPINIYGTGKQVRDILFVTDAAKAVNAFYQRRASGVYPIGGGPAAATSLLEAIDLLGGVLGKPPEFRFGPERHGDLKYFICDIANAKWNLGWKPGVLPADGIPRLVSWVVENKELFKP